MKKTEKILFERFLADKNSYNLNIGYWRRTLQLALSKKIETSEQPVINKDNNGKNFYDGNPIFSFRDKQKNLSVRIIQEDPKESNISSNKLKIDAWVDDLRIPGKDSDETIKELVISLFLTTDTIKKCTQLVIDWFDLLLDEVNLEAYVLEANNLNNDHFPWINREEYSDSVGKQPVRVLEQKINDILERTITQTMDMTLLFASGLQPGIAYYSNNMPVKAKVDGHYQTPFVNSKGEIHLHETFLSYVWGITYTLFIQYDELIAKASVSINNPYLRQLNINRSKDVFDYAFSLLTTYQDWDKGKIPNPEYFRADQAEYINKTNTIFLYAIDYVLCHEVSHVSEKHHITKPMSSAESILREQQVDELAFGLVMKSVPANERESAIIGTLSGLCSLLFFNNFTAATNHPETDNRIYHFLNYIKVNDEHPAWAYAILALKLWDNRFGKLFSWSTYGKTNYKELFKFVKEQIENDNNMQ